MLSEQWPLLQVYILLSLWKLCINVLKYLDDEDRTMPEIGKWKKLKNLSSLQELEIHQWIGDMIEIY